MAALISRILGILMATTIAVLQFTKIFDSYVGKWVIVILALLFVISSVIAEVFLWREGKKRERKDEQREERNQKFQIELVEAVRKEMVIPLVAPSGPPKVDEFVQVGPDDPMVYLEIKPSSESMFQRTPFLLHNRGKTTAHNVTIRPFKLDRKTVTFKTVGEIGPDKTADILPEVQGVGHMQKHDIFYWLVKDWDGNGEVIADWPINISIDYTDPLGKKSLRTSLKLVFHPVLHIMHRGVTQRNDPPFLRKEPTLEYTDIHIAAVKPQ